MSPFLSPSSRARLWLRRLPPFSGKNDCDTWSANNNDATTVLLTWYILLYSVEHVNRLVIGLLKLNAQRSAQKTAIYIHVINASSHRSVGLFQFGETSSLWVMTWVVHADAHPRPVWKQHARKCSVRSRMWGVWRTNEVTSVPSGWEKAPAVGVSSHTGHRREDDANSKPCRDTHQPRPHPNVPQLFHCSGPFHSPQAGLGIISLVRKKLCKSFYPPRCTQGPLTWVDILICCRQSLPPPLPWQSREQHGKKKKKERVDKVLLNRRRADNNGTPESTSCAFWSPVVAVMRFKCARTAECLRPPGPPWFLRNRGSWLGESITEGRLLARGCWWKKPTCLIADSNGSDDVYDRWKAIPSTHWDHNTERCWKREGKCCPHLGRPRL